MVADAFGLCAAALAVGELRRRPACAPPGPGARTGRPAATRALTGSAAATLPCRVRARTGHDDLDVLHDVSLDDGFATSLAHDGPAPHRAERAKRAIAVGLVGDVDIDVLVARFEWSDVSTLGVRIDDGLRAGARDPDAKLVVLKVTDAGDDVKPGRVLARARNNQGPQDEMDGHAFSTSLQGSA